MLDLRGKVHRLFPYVASTIRDKNIRNLLVGYVSAAEDQYQMISPRGRELVSLPSLSTFVASRIKVRLSSRRPATVRTERLRQISLCSRAAKI